MKGSQHTDIKNKTSTFQPAAGPADSEPAWPRAGWVACASRLSGAPCFSSVSQVRRAQEQTKTNTPTHTWDRLTQIEVESQVHAGAVSRRRQSTQCEPSIWSMQPKKTYHWDICAGLARARGSRWARAGVPVLTERAVCSTLSQCRHTSTNTQTSKARWGGGGGIPSTTARIKASPATTNPASGL